MNEPDLFWLAGLLEGEGSFQRPTPSDLKYPRITIQMADYDVIEQVTSLFEVHYISTRKAKKANHKDTYATLVKGKRAVRLMCQLYPLMGERRRQQIEAAIGERPPFEMVVVSEQNWFYWLVGLLEGEGSFKKGAPEKPSETCFHLKMTDADVVQRASDLLEVKRYGPYKTKSVSRPYSEKWKDHYDVLVWGSKAIEWMQRLRPYMGQRRQAQIDAVIAAYHLQPRTYYYGEDHPQSKLTSDNARDIKRRLLAGEKLTALAREYGVDTGLIWQIKAGRIWQQIPWPERAPEQA